MNNGVLNTLYEMMNPSPLADICYKTWYKIILGHGAPKCMNLWVYKKNENKCCDKLWI